jgi:hypothetical protein
LKHSSLNRALAKQRPETIFTGPFELISERLLTKGEKLGTLDRWRRNLLQDAADKPGLTAEHVRLLRQIEEAKGQLAASSR